MKRKDYTQALTLGFFTGWYDSIVNLMGFGKRYYAKAADYIQPGDRDSILDVGTGTANLAIAIRQKYPRVKVTGIDPDKEILEIAKKKIKKEKFDIELINTPAQKLPFPSESFDFVVSSLAIHHIPKSFKKESFSEMKRVLKRNGVILIVDFGIPKNFFADIISFILSLLEDVGPNRKGLIPNALNDLGFKDIKEVGNKFGLISFYKARK
ncbi:MAG: class I SAM-dependent methyltransferase [Candidatus Levybacteria bacterium]|nr:class I SAM-dependent methyltransferase [Candidatus Levybacteria bacterium]